VKLFVVDPHAIHRRGLVPCLESLPAVESVGAADSIPAARGDDRLLTADLVIVDPVADPADGTLNELSAQVIVCSSELLGNLLEGVAAERPHDTPLTEREQQVLALIAAGHQTREVAQQLCYSERTVKNVLHDVVTKLNARSRSQAVAFAVREGLI
jgi:DNA-binding NarL/FixJ family response regulator